MVELSRPRSSTLLKHRLLEAHRADVVAGLDWAESEPSLEVAAALITGARRRFVIGAATSFTYASLLASQLSEPLAKVTLVDGALVRPLDILSDVNDSDVMVAISLRPYRRSTVQVAVPFVAAGGTLVVITDARDAPLARYAEAAIVIGDGDLDADGDGDADADGDTGPEVAARWHPASPSVSPLVMAMVIDVLTALAGASAKGAGRRLAHRERLALELGLYLTP